MSMHNAKRVLLASALLASFALGGAALAGAVSKGSTAPTAATTTGQTGPNRPARTPETALTGAVAANVKAAAVAEVGGTVERVETDGDGHAAYEAHVTKADGSRVTVYVDKSYAVVSVEAIGGRGHGGAGRGGARGGRGSETALTGDTAAKVKAAAIAKVGGTVERVETDADGNAAYEAHVTRADGSQITVYVDKSFTVVGTESRGS